MSATEDSGPPRRVEAWLERLLEGVPDAASTLGDLAEGYHTHVRRAGRGPARRWYMRQALSLLVHRRRMSPPPAAHPGRSGVAAQFLGDLRHALRAARRRPAHTIGVSGLLLVAIATTTAALTLTVGSLAAARWWQEEERMVLVWPEARFSRGQIDVLRTENTAFEAVGGVLLRPTLLGTGARSKSLRGAVLSPELFRALKAEPRLGRGLEPADAAPGAEPVVVLGHGVWTDFFGAAPGVLGRVVDVSGVPRRVVGVMPAGAEQPGPGTALWLPLVLDSADPDFWPARELAVVAIRRAGVTELAARDDVRRVLGELAQRFSFFFRTDYGSDATVAPVAGGARDAVATPLLLLLAGTLLLLLVAAIDVANLTLARSLDRHTELRVRAAMGATRTRIARQLAAEAAVHTLPAAVGGWALAAGLARLLPGLFPTSAPVAAVAPTAPAVLLWVGATGMLAWLLVVAISVFHFLGTTRVELKPRHGRRRTNGGLVVAQAALSTALLVTAALLMRTVHGLGQVPLGFDPVSASAVPVAPPAAPLPGAALDALRSDVAARLAARPDVRAVGWISTVPFLDVALSGPVRAEGEEVTVAMAPTPARVVADGGALAALGVRLVAGRSFTDADDAAGPRVALVSASLARMLWGDADPVGRRMAVDPHAWESWVQVVGVVEDMRLADLTSTPPPAFFLPPAQAYTPVMTLVIRSGTAPPVLAAATRTALADLAPEVAAGSGRALADLVRDAQGQARVLTGLLGILSVLATALGAAGLYGALAGWVARRRKELGTRLALGATPWRLSTGVLLTAVALTGSGVALGSVAAAVAGRAIRSLLYGISPLDPLAHALPAALLLVTALLAAAVPAVRAARVVPAQALRDPS